jgi:hypothetical protein
MEANPMAQATDNRTTKALTTAAGAGRTRPTALRPPGIAFKPQVADDEVAGETPHQLSEAPTCPDVVATAYIYEIWVDGVLRYVGKGRNGRAYCHVKEARRSEKRCGRKTSHLYPYFHRKLVEAMRRGLCITEKIIISGLTDRDAYRIEERMIGELHKSRSGQLWNTIDERFIDPKYLPEKWSNPVDPIYKLPRPLKTTWPHGSIRCTIMRE